MMKKIPVEGHKNLVRDEGSGAILNTNSSSINDARRAKYLRQKSEAELQELKNEVMELRKILNEMVKKK